MPAPIANLRTRVASRTSPRCRPDPSKTSNIVASSGPIDAHPQPALLIERERAVGEEVPLLGYRRRREARWRLGGSTLPRTFHVALPLRGECADLRRRQPRARNVTVNHVSLAAVRIEQDDAVRSDAVADREGAVARDGDAHHVEVELGSFGEQWCSHATQRPDRVAVEPQQRYFRTRELRDRDDRCTAIRRERGERRQTVQPV